MWLPCWWVNCQHGIYSQATALKAVEQQRSLYIVFVNFSKAFDTVNRWTLWKVLKAYGHPESFINMIRQFHDGMTGRVSIEGDISDAFPINHRVNRAVFWLPHFSLSTLEQCWKQCLQT